MKVCNTLKRIFAEFFKSKINKHYSVADVFGCPECPPQDCPTFIERDVHRKFKDAIINNNIIVVYGESRQGKTWTIERYCPKQLRIGCTSSKTVRQLKQDMLDVLGIKIRQVEHSVTEEVKAGTNTSSKVGNEMIGAAGMDANLSTSRLETLKTEYTTVDLDNDIEFLNIIKEKAKDRYYIFDNFHYLPQNIQKEFCSLLKEFNYHNVKIIIVGVWKEASRITALAPDLINRCEHIDIGSWSTEELDQVVKKGEKALNISVGEIPQMKFKECCASNIGIFKTFLLKYVQQCGVYETQPKFKILDKKDILNKVMENVINEAYTPLLDRIKNLALPQRNRKDSKRMRLKIVVSILELVKRYDINKIQNGISLESIKMGVDKLCDTSGENRIDISNITQELGVIHQREENRQAKGNFISLFYFDKANRKLLIIEPTLYEIRAYDVGLIDRIIETILENEHEYRKRC